MGHIWAVAVAQAVCVCSHWECVKMLFVFYISVCSTELITWLNKQGKKTVVSKKAYQKLALTRPWTMKHDKSWLNKGFRNKGHVGTEQFHTGFALWWSSVGLTTHLATHLNHTDSLLVCALSITVFPKNCKRTVDFLFSKPFIFLFNNNGENVSNDDFIRQISLRF